MKTLRINLYLILLLLSLIKPTYVFATDVSGPVSGVWTLAGSPYNVVGDIFLPANRTLTIEPGVQVIFQGWYKFVIYGSLLSIGTAQDSILFTATSNSSGWQGLRFINASDSSRLEYCHITRGKDEHEDGQGGAIYLKSSDLTLHHCLIDSCSASWRGGAISCDSSSNTLIESSRLQFNYISGANGNGGAIFIGHLSTTHILNNFFSYNQAASGGALYREFDAGIPLIQGNQFDHNSAYLQGGAIWCYEGATIIANTIEYNSVTCTYGDGGGIYMTYADNQPFSVISGNIIRFNSATNSGYGGGLCFYWSHIILTDNQILYNTAGYYGGGIRLSQGYYSDISHNNFSHNVSTRYGGAVSIVGGSANFSNNIFNGNSAGNYGGAIDGFAGIIYSCTFYFNSANDGGSAINCDMDFITANNCIFWSDSTDLFSGSETGTPTITYSDVKGGWTGVGNIEAPPLFVDASGDDFHLQSTTGSYHNGLWLHDLDNSPCIDEGDPASPYANEPLPNGDRINMGFEGNTQEASYSWIEGVTPSNPSCPERFIINQNFPNPFNPTTVISFNLPTTSFVNLSVYDISGRKIAELVNGRRDAGTHQITFDGSKLASGIYLCRIQAGEYTATQKLVLLK
jgi:putative cofactor-binding repeat protein